MHIDIQSMIHHFGYGGVFFILLFEMIGIPFPAETTLTVAGMEWTHGVFSLVPLLLSAALGNIVGSSCAYLIGRFFGRPVILRFGKYVGITSKRLDVANEKFGRYQIGVILVSKFIAGIRVLIPYLAGINRMSFLKFSVLNAIGALAWALVFITVGKYIGIEWTHYHRYLRHALAPTAILVVLVLVVYVGLKLRKRSRKRHEK